MRVLGFSGFTRTSRAGEQRRTLGKTGLEFESLFTYRDGEVPFTRFPLGYLGHDAAAALVIDGEVVAAAAEERFTRTKHGLNLAGNTLLPRRAMRYCLDAAGLGMSDVDVVAHYCAFTEAKITQRARLLRPFLTDDETPLLEAAYREQFDAMLSPAVIRAQLASITETAERDVVGVDHCLAHAASAFYASGFDESMILTLDGTGEVESSLLAVGRPAAIEEIGRVDVPHSLGAMYLLFTMFLGFRSLGDEYKVMGLAAYGKRSRFRSFFADVVRLGPEGSYATPLLASADLRAILEKHLGAARTTGEPLEQRHADVAAALQGALETAVLHTLAHARARTGVERLCMAGGVALNCAMNGVVARSGLFRELFVQPASGDDGGAVGAALYAAQSDSPNRRWEHSLLGPSFSEADVHAALARAADDVTWTAEEDIAAKVAREIDRGRIIGWFQDRMEYGPRALGSRSIVADPRDPGMKDRINSLVKRREEFRPFAPAVLEEAAPEWFDLTGLSSSPFMLFAVPVRPGRAALIPAVTHVDGTARIQTVSPRAKTRYRRLIEQFGELTGVPIVLNTSFNVGREPIVCTPADALKCFLSTEIDALAIDRFYVEKRPR